MKNQPDLNIKEAQAIDAILDQIADEENKDHQIEDYRKIVKIASDLDNSHE